MQRLWRQGFFGKGFLSRSEPSWRRRVENRRAELEGKEKREPTTKNLLVLYLKKVAFD
jgi:tRNA-splicing endonuclease subunit Sen2